MDLNYLQNVILPKREKEISEGKNLATRQPIYVVYQLEEKACEGHSEFLGSNTNHKGKEPKHGYIQRDYGEPEFKESDEGMERPQAVTIFWIDRAVAFFFTSEEAHAYLDYQGHNLDEGYVFVHYTGYANREMDALLCGG